MPRNSKDVTPNLMPHVAPMTPEELDAAINSKIKEAADQVARTYLEIAAYLREMRDSEGYRQIGFEKWENYLDSKHDFGRSYLSYLYKLGQAEGLQAYLVRGMTGTKLIEFAKRTDFPEKIPQLIDATWEEVKDKSVRETSRYLNKYVQENDGYKRQRERKGGRPRATLRDRFFKDYQKLPETERETYLRTMKEFLREMKAKP